jgi:hypothetical protein
VSGLMLRRVSKNALARLAGLVVTILLAPLAANGGVAVAGEGASPAAGAVKIELNKVEQTDKGCRFYWLVNNQTDMAIEKLQVAFYWFRGDGVIGGDLKFGFAPAAAKKMLVKQYMLPDKPCDGFASLLLNEISACESKDGPIENCGDRLAYASRSKIEFLQ